MIVRSRRAVSVLEFIIAASLILAVLVASGITLTNVERSLATSRARDGATLVANNILSQASQFGCQLEVNPRASAPNDVSAAARRCYERLSQEAAPQGFALPAGDMAFKTSYPAGCVTAAEAAADSSKTPTPGCIEYSVMVSSRWLRANADQAKCQSPSRQPSIIQRRVEIRWTPPAASEEVVYVTTGFQAVPQSRLFTDESLRGLLVRGTPGSVVHVSDGGSLRIARVLQPCTADTSSAPTGEAWFPYLPSGVTYSVISGGSVNWPSAAITVGSNPSNGVQVSNCPSSSLFANGSLQGCGS